MISFRRFSLRTIWQWRSKICRRLASSCFWILLLASSITFSCVVTYIQFLVMCLLWETNVCSPKYIQEMKTYNIRWLIFFYKEMWSGQCHLCTYEWFIAWFISFLFRTQLLSLSWFDRYKYLSTLNGQTQFFV